MCYRTKITEKHAAINTSIRGCLFAVAAFARQLIFSLIRVYGKKWQEIVNPEVDFKLGNVTRYYL
jgi:hypothetical protein